MKNKKIISYALIAAIYTVLSLITGSFSFAGIQIRVGELLMVLCIFDKQNVLPLTLGCFITNLIGVMMGFNAIPLDIIFGTVATLISGLLMHKLKDIKLFNKPILSLLMPGIINGIVVGFELALLLNSNNFLPLFLTNALWIFLGELISVYILGILLFEPIEKMAEYIKSIN